MNLHTLRKTGDTPRRAKLVVVCLSSIDRKGKKEKVTVNNPPVLPDGETGANNFFGVVD